MMTRIFALGALLVPAVVLAQPAPDPDAPPPPQPSPVTNNQAPAVVVNPAPAPAPAPVTVVTPSPEPQYEVVEDSYNAPIFLSGALVFGAAYGASVITAASDDSTGNDRLYIPVVGPWLALSDRSSCDITDSRCNNETTAKVLLIADGVFQAAGVIGMLDGIFQPSSRRVITRTAKADTKVRVTPSVVHGEPGVAVFGRF